ncbi:2150_t:CDS:2 [Cetraspora pellucida]|uniref:2150_t:CDS:1 n=1 Tax=Cetraspora pellucida TaxID=1433469 RepID=A0A9N9NJK6_9GLOM|nr:2150_t:CDS:2 [Cetraspora pellucida]
MPSNNNALNFVFVDPSRQISRQRLAEENRALNDKISFLEAKISSLETELSSLRRLETELSSIRQLVSQLTLLAYLTVYQGVNGSFTLSISKRIFKNGYEVVS